MWLLYRIIVDCFIVLLWSDVATHCIWRKIWVCFLFLNIKRFDWHQKLWTWWEFCTQYTMHTASCLHLHVEYTTTVPSLFTSVVVSLVIIIITTTICTVMYHIYITWCYSAKQWLLNVTQASSATIINSQ